MARRFLILGLFAVSVAGFFGCRAEYNAVFTHRLNDPPPRILVTAGLPFYRVHQWVEFKAMPQKPLQGGWMGHEWSASGPGSHAMEWRYRQDPDSGVEMADVVWGRFYTPGIWTVQLAVMEQAPLRCRNPKCGKPLPKLPFKGGIQVVCPACKEAVRVPSVPTGVMGAAARSKPEEILIIDVGPKRFLDGDPKKGYDPRPIVTIFPEGGWVYVGERFNVSLFGVVMHNDAGKGVEWTRDRVIKKVEVDFGDGSKKEEYVNPSSSEEIRHQLVEHIYVENGYYEVKVRITDSASETYDFARVVLAADKPTSGYDKLVGSIVDRLVNSEIGKKLVGRNVIIYNLENLTTYSDADNLFPIEDQMIQQFHQRGIKVLERDEEILRRWAPEIFGVLPNTFSKDLAMYSPAEWSEFGNSLKVETARPDYLVEYRIVEENVRLEDVGKFNEATNRWELVATETGNLTAKFRKRVLKIYFRITDGKTGPDSTQVLFTDIMTGAAEDFVVADLGSLMTPDHGGAAGAQGSAGQRVRCSNCNAVNVVQDAKTGDKILCHNCKKTFEYK